jgi:hypothetical protein
MSKPKQMSARDAFEVYGWNMGLVDFEQNEFGHYRNPFVNEPWNYFKAGVDYAGAELASMRASRDALAMALARLEEAARKVQSGEWDRTSIDVERRVARAALAVAKKGEAS